MNTCLNILFRTSRNPKLSSGINDRSKTARQVLHNGMSIRVKICGVTRVEDALAAVHLGANAIGFVFWRQSARYVAPANAREIITALPPFVTTVGVYVDPDPEWVKETSSVAGLNLLQFHGDEPPDFCEDFRCLI